MTALIILIALVVVGPLAIRYGVDSRDVDTRGRQPHWPAG
jgi:hypothetical protein